MNHVPPYIQWWFVQIAVPNLIVIVLMLVVFGLALILPYPHGRSRRGTP